MIELFGERLAKAIKTSRHHRTTVACGSGMTRSRLSDLIKGIETPTIDEVDNLSNFLQTSSIWLLTGKHKR